MVEAVRETNAHTIAEGSASRCPDTLKQTSQSGLQQCSFLKKNVNSTVIQGK
jgi:hypothetical protein